MLGSSEGTSFKHNILRAILQGLIAGIVLGAVFAAGFFYRDVVAAPAQSETSFNLLQEADSLLSQYFLYPPPEPDKRVYGAVQGLVASFGDPYTFFVEPQTAELDTGNLAGRFGGIGADITQNEAGQFVIIEVYPGNPAFEAGIERGDVLIAVDGYEIDPSTDDIDSVVSRIRGEVGEAVMLTVLRDAGRLEFEVIRAEVLIPSTFWHILDEDSRVGYIRVTRFTDRSPGEVRQAIAELKAQSAQALILDLRDNGGGLVDSAVGVTSEFLDGGPILYEEKQGGQEQAYNASRGGTGHDIPLVVLVNQNTASASEIVAGALQDRERATLVGQKTYGKGSVQLILPLSDGSSLHVTTAQWYTPNHNPLQGQGLTPDIIIEPVAASDVQLEAAVAYLAENVLASEALSNR